MVRIKRGKIIRIRCRKICKYFKKIPYRLFRFTKIQCIKYMIYCLESYYKALINDGYLEEIHSMTRIYIINSELYIVTMEIIPQL